MNVPNTYGELTPCGGGDPIPLFKRKLVIGRRSNCDVTLSFPNVSSQHCELELINGYWYVKDLNSANGIKVNDVRCDSKWLMPGDTLSIAKHRFEISYTAMGEAPAMEEENPFARSLMEKAGLERSRPVGPRSESSDRRTAAPDSAPKNRPEDEDAMRWLEDDE